MKLKNILDDFGYEKVQKGEFPEIPTIPDNFNGGEHQYDLFAFNGVFAISEDEKNIVVLTGIAKTSEGFERTGGMPNNTLLETDNAAKYLEGFKQIYSFKNRWAFVKEHGMHFQGIGAKLEKAGELYQK